MRDMSCSLLAMDLMVLGWELSASLPLLQIGTIRGVVNAVVQVEHTVLCFCSKRPTTEHPAILLQVNTCQWK